MNRLSSLFEKIPNNATPHEQARIEFSNRMRIALARTRTEAALKLNNITATPQLSVEAGAK